MSLILHKKVVNILQRRNEKSVEEKGKREMGEVIQTAIE